MEVLGSYVRPLPADQARTPVVGVARSEYRFRSDLTSALTIVVKADSPDRAREELARIGLHPSFFELLDASEEAP